MDPKVTDCSNSEASELRNKSLEYDGFLTQISQIPQIVLEHLPSCINFWFPLQNFVVKYEKDACEELQHPTAKKCSSGVMLRGSTKYSQAISGYPNKVHP